MTEQIQSGLKSRRAVSEIIGISIPTIIRLEKEGLLQPVRVRRRVLFEESEIERFIRSAKQQTR